MAWHAGLPAANRVHSSFAHRLPSRPLSTDSFCATSRLSPEARHWSGAPRRSASLLKLPLRTRFVSAAGATAGAAPRMAKTSRQAPGPAFLTAPFAPGINPDWRDNLLAAKGLQSSARLGRAADGVAERALGGP